MIPTQTFDTYPEFANTGTKEKPDDSKYSEGFVAADVLPHEWVNWFWNKSSKGITDLNEGLESVEKELVAILTAAGITPAEATEGQVNSAIDLLIQNKTGTLSNLTTTAKGNLVAAINELKTSVDGKSPLAGSSSLTTCSQGTFGSAATKTAGSAAGNVPLVGTALGTTNNNIVVTDTNGKLKPSGTTLGSAAGKTAGSASGNVPLVGTALGTTNNNIVCTNTSGQLIPSGMTTEMAVAIGNAGAVCGTAIGTAAKTISINGFTLYTGVVVKVLFTNGNNAASPTLNVNSTGAKSIKVVRAGAKITPINHTGSWRSASSASTYTEMWQPYTTLEFIYDGTDWVIIGNPTVESFYSTTKCYEVKADGLIEQWGKISGTSTNTVSLIVAYSDSNYLVLRNSYGQNSSAENVNAYSGIGRGKTDYNTSNFSFYTGDNAMGTLWYTKGY